MVWADFPGDAWASSDKALLYAVSFTLFAAWPWGPNAATATLGLFALGVTVVAALTVAEASLSIRPIEYFVESRLFEPIGYANGNVALWSSAVFPAVYLATLRAAPILVRSLSAAAAAFLLEVSVLGQARAWLVVLPIVGALFVALARQRLRVLGGLALAGGGAGVAAPAVLDVYARAGSDATLGPALDRAGGWMAATSVAVALVAAVWAAVDRRLRLAPRLHRSLAGIAGLALVAALTIAAVRASPALAHPIRWVEGRWEEFTQPDRSGEAEGSRFASGLGGDRYHEWRIALREFRNHPVQGIGAGNYGPAYLLHRVNGYHEPASAHSTPLRLLSELGVVGTLLFAVFAGASLVLVARRRASLAPPAAGAVAAATAVFLYWLVHGTVDWLWELPVLAGPAFGLLGLAGAIVPQPAVAEEGVARGRRRGPRWAAAVVGVGALLAALGSVALPWLSSAYTEAGAAVWRKRPAAAYARLERAADLNPLSAEPLVIEGSIALKRRDLAVAERALAEAIRREPNNWYAYLQLALLHGSQGRFRLAARSLASARALNPLDPGIELAAKLVRRRAVIDPDRVNDVYIEAANRRFGRRIFGTDRYAGR